MKAARQSREGRFCGPGTRHGRTHPQQSQVAGTEVALAVAVWRTNHPARGAVRGERLPGPRGRRPDRQPPRATSGQPSPDRPLQVLPVFWGNLPSFQGTTPVFSGRDRRLLGEPSRLIREGHPVFSGREWVGRNLRRMRASGSRGWRYGGAGMRLSVLGAIQSPASRGKLPGFSGSSPRPFGESARLVEECAPSCSGNLPVLFGKDPAHYR